MRQVPRLELGRVLRKKDSSCTSFAHGTNPPGAVGDLATSKSINNDQEARGKEDGSSIQKSQWHHQPLLSATSRAQALRGEKH